MFGDGHSDDIAKVLDIKLSIPHKFCPIKVLFSNAFSKFKDGDVFEKRLSPIKAEFFNKTYEISPLTKTDEEKGRKKWYNYLDTAIEIGLGLSTLGY